MGGPQQRVRGWLALSARMGVGLTGAAAAAAAAARSGAGCANRLKTIETVCTMIVSLPSHIVSRRKTGHLGSTGTWAGGSDQCGSARMWGKANYPLVPRKRPGVVSLSFYAYAHTALRCVALHTRNLRACVCVVQIDARIGYVLCGGRGRSFPGRSFSRNLGDLGIASPGERAPS